MDPNAKKKALRMIGYGLYVVTTQHGAERGAFLCNWLTQCSFEPPMVVVAVEEKANSLQVMRTAGRFVVNVLETGQRELAGWFGRHSAKVGDKLANHRTETTPSGQPRLPEALAWFECVLTTEVPAGDHVLVVGELADVGLVRDGTPLPLKETGFWYAG